MADIAREPIAAVAEILREFLDETGRDAHVLATEVLEAAEAVWPHEPPKRDISGTTGGDFALGPRAQPFRRNVRPVRPAPPFGFGPPQATRPGSLGGEHHA